MRRTKRPTTDLGTVILHWVLVATLVAAAATGLRIASDDPGLQWLRLFDAVLPVENLWLIHLTAAIALVAGLVAYWVYLARSRLLARVSLGWPHVLNLMTTGPLRWAVAGVLGLWLLMIALTVEMATGLLMFAGFGGLVLELHVAVTWICIAFPVVHVAFHWLRGGGHQVMRIVRPVGLVIPPPPPDFAVLLAQHLQKGLSGEPSKISPPAKQRRRWPLAWAIGSAMMISTALLALEPVTRQQLLVARVDPGSVPRLDGDLSDPAWAKAPVTRVLTQHGANFDGTGESLVEIRAVHDGTTAYFAFTWTDPTRSLKHLPLVKRADGWHLMQTAHDHADESAYFEDKFSVLLVRPVFPLIGAAIHLTARPLSARPPSLTGRGLHYTVNGGLADVWQWHADHADIIDDGYFGGPATATPEQTNGLTRYAGGYVKERGPARYADNFVAAKSRDYSDAVRPRRFPKNIAALLVAMGRIRDNPELSEEEASQWWLTLENSTPYSDVTDAAIPLGTVLPGVLVLKPDTSSSKPCGAARWSAGRWTLTMSRALKPADGAGITIETGTMMWVAAFDHSETRHTRHMRPIVLEVQNAS